MSGGSMDYLYSKVEDAGIRGTTPLRRAFAKHLQLVAVALHDIEWVDSCDMSPGDEDAAIRACLAPGAALAQSVADAQAAFETMREELEKQKEGRP